MEYADEFLSGLAVLDWPEKTKMIRDWLVSRQHDWDTPLPIVHCESCGQIPVPEDELPLRLPHDREAALGDPKVI